MYSGKVSSHLVAPSLESTLESTHELNYSNFSALSRSYSEDFAMKSLLSRLTSAEYINRAHIDIIAAHHIFSKSIVISNSSILAKYSEVARELILNYRSKNVFFHYWYRVMNVRVLTEFLKTKINFDLSYPPSCHLGKRLISTGPFFWGFLPPNSKSLALIFKRLVESGIVFRMEQESYSLTHSIRIQDRLRVKSKTEIVFYNKKRLDIKAPQRLEGKMVKVFLIWGVMILASCSILCLEYFLNIWKTRLYVCYRSVQIPFLAFSS